MLSIEVPGILDPQYRYLLREGSTHPSIDTKRQYYLERYVVEYVSIRAEQVLLRMGIKERERGRGGNPCSICILFTQNIDSPVGQYLMLFILS